MKEIRPHLDFEIDKLTNSIENAITGEIFGTVITEVSDASEIKIKDWQFDWRKETKREDKEVFKLTTVNNPTVIQGLICISDKGDHICMDVIENAKFNKGKKKLYRGVAGNLVGFVCKTAFERDYDGLVAFVAKTQLIEHYKTTLGAKQLTKNRMYIDTQESLALVKQYFKDFKHG